MDNKSTPNRRAQLLRLELADQIRLFLEGELPGEHLMDWAMDHSFYDDRSELSPDDTTIIGLALGRILTMGPEEPLYQRTTREQLAETVQALADM
ncbi:MAG: hypothetical protein LC769_04515 [Chloroflexi bacterium]|nr:hypothetical protein [Chloroflexota bacterium]